MIKGQSVVIRGVKKEGGADISTGNVSVTEKKDLLTGEERRRCGGLRGDTHTSTTSTKVNARELLFRLATLSHL